MLRCRQVGPYSVLAAAPAYLCSGLVYAPYRIAALVLAVMWVAGLAAVATVVLLWLRFTNNLSQQPLSARFGVLYEAYRPECFWWEVTVMARRTLVTALTLIDDPALSFLVRTALCISITAMQAYVKPYRQEIENRAEYLSLVLLAWVAVCNLFAVQSSGYAASAAIYTADVLAGSGALLLLVYALYMARSSIVAAVGVVRARAASFGSLLSGGVAKQTSSLEMALLETQESGEKSAADP